MNKPSATWEDHGRLFREWARLDGDPPDETKLALAEVYDLLERLARRPALVPVNFTPIIGKAGVLPAPIQKLIQEAATALQGDASAVPGTLRERLNAFRRFCTDPGYERLPETRSLLVVVSRWTSALAALEQAGPTHFASVKLDFLPSLDLKHTEEWETSSARYIDTGILLINEGQLPVTTAELSYPMNLPPLVRSISINGATNDKYSIRDGIEGGDTHLARLRVEYTDEYKLDISVNYHDIRAYQGQPSESPVSRRANKPLGLLWPSRLQEGVELRNPYVVDHAIPEDNPLLQGVHREVKDEILEELLRGNAKKAGGLWAIRGLARTGKSTLLRMLEQSLDKTLFLPVYVDAYSWSVELLLKGLQLSMGELLYEMADQLALTLPEGELQARISEQLGSFKDWKMNSSEFQDFVKSANNVIGKQVVFLIDEADVLQYGDPITEEAIISCIDTAVYNGVCSFVLTYLWAAESKLHMGFSKTARYHRVSFLSREETRFLAQKAPVRYTELATNCVWQMSGGWPALVQRIYYETFAIARQAFAGTNKRVLVDVGTVKGVIRDMAGTTKYSNFVQQLLASLDDAEIALLSFLGKEGFILLDTGQIKGIWRLPQGGVRLESDKAPEGMDSARIAETIKSLKDKQIIDFRTDGSQSAYLRVGILSNPAILDLWKSRRQLWEEEKIGHRRANSQPCTELADQV